MLTCEQIFEALNPDDLNGLVATRYGRRERLDITKASAAQLEFLNVRSLARITCPVQEHRHPSDFADDGAQRPMGRLSGAEREWLSRLPIRELHMVHGSDARKVAQLRKAVAADATFPAEDLAFIDNIWAPINTYHRRKQLESRLKMLDLPDVMPGVELVPAALADAIVYADRDTTRAQAALEADRRLKEWKAQRRSTLEQSKAHVISQLHKLPARAAA
jgi:hypothetical protein